MLCAVFLKNIRSFANSLLADSVGATKRKRPPQQQPNITADSTNAEQPPAASSTANDSHVESTSSTMTDLWNAFATRFTADVQAVKRAVRFDETVQAGAAMLHDWLQKTQTQNSQTNDSSQGKDSSYTTSQTKESSSSIAAFHRPPR
jgi:hypothetical protein